MSVWLVRLNLSLRSDITRYINAVQLYEVRKTSDRGEMKKFGGGLGKHLIVELFECDSEALDSVETVERALVEAAIASGSTIVNRGFHRFKPHGVSGYVLVAESHLSVHTWPEYGYAAVDVFTCGAHTNPWEGLEVLKRYFGAKRVMVMEITRGVGVEEQYRGYWRPALKSST